MQQLLNLQDLRVKEIEIIFRKTDEFKERPVSDVLKGKTIALLFEKPSTRTRTSFEVAMAQLGGHAVYLNKNDLQLSRGESLEDTARTLSRYVDAIVARFFSHKDLITLAKHSSVPVINALTDMYHPCQALADMYTIDEKLGKLRGVKLAFLGDGSSNVCHSLMLACSKLGMNMIVACPKELEPSESVLKTAERNAKIVGSKIKIMRDPERAVKDVEIIYTDTWVSMGKEKESEKRIKLLKRYQVNPKLIEKAKSLCLFMHCLPAFRGMEVTSDVIDGPYSVVWEQAENRLHVQKALLSLML